jgi:hypothetical protein
MKLYETEITAVKQLQKIASTKSFRGTGKRGVNKRIEFLELLNKSMLLEKVRRYDLFDEYKIGERTIDTCFEMGDSDEVIAGIITKANNDPELLKAMIANHGEALIEDWQSRQLHGQEVLI